MQLVAALSAGVRGAENGTATFTLRGTATPATLYSSFEGDAFVGSVATLDSHGAYEIYVNDLVDVVVKDSVGVALRSFTEGASAKLVEYSGQSFTGTNYSGGPSGINKPTTAQAIFDAWYTSAGAIDFKVDLGGVATNLSAAFAALGVTTFYNVKSTAYGAAGNGTSDDTSAINAAISAAGVLGGIVFFPAGTYRITSALTPNGKVHFLGVGPGESIIKLDHASNNAIAYSATTTTRYQTLRDLQVINTQANTGSLVLPTSGSKLLLENCILGDSFTKYAVGDGTGVASLLRLRGCTITIGNTAGKAVKADSTTSSQIDVYDCLITPPSSHSGTLVEAGRLNAINTRFNTAGGGYTTTCLSMASQAGVCLVVGCEFNDPASGTVTAIALGTLAANGKVHEEGNFFGASVVPYSYINAVAATRIHLGTREKLHYRTTDNSATLAVPADQYGVMVLRRSNTTTQTLNFATAPLGSRFTLVIYNDSGFAFAGPTVYGTGVGADTVTDPADTAVSVFSFVSATHDGTNLVWLQTGDETNFAPS